MSTTSSPSPPNVSSPPLSPASTIPLNVPVQPLSKTHTCMSPAPNGEVTMSLSADSLQDSPNRTPPSSLSDVNLTSNISSPATSNLIPLEPQSAISTSRPVTRA
ncbi:hypothetical protein AgCh_033154 [Apium graveolens]